MKKLLLLMLISGLIVCYSCKKKDNSTGDPTPFQYKSLVASDTLVTVNDVISITADATGDGLSYSWESTDMDGNVYGTIIGSGSQVQWSICHQSKFKVSCAVSDKYSHSETKTVYIRSH